MMAFKNSSIKKNSYLVQIAKKKLEIHGIPSKQFLRNLDEISRSIRNKGNTFSASLFASAETRYRETSVGIKFISRQQRKIPTYISDRKIKLVYPFYVSFFALFFSYRKIDIYIYVHCMVENNIDSRHYLQKLYTLLLSKFIERN